jgi:pyruvate/2-oxoglutarate dehydrogenase complex dihydrolipoamide dehydrogenase (E3) component
MRQLDLPGGRRLDWPEIIRQSRVGVEENLAGNVARPPIPVVEGSVRFTGPERIELDGRLVRFRRAVLAVERATPPLESPGADECEYLTEATLERMPGVPATLAIVGAGAEACSWAQVFHRLGSQVHLICPGGRLLPDKDPEIAELLQSQLTAEGIRLHLDAAPPTFARMGHRKAVLLGVGDEQRKLLVDEVLYLGPQRIVLAGLDLEAAGVAVEGGQVRVNAALRTSNRRIFVAAPPDDVLPWCVGDLVARIAVANAALRFCVWPWSARLCLDLAPRTVHTRLQAIQVGLKPARAAAQPDRFAIYRAELSPGPGLLKLVLTRGSGRVAGATIVAPSAEAWLAPLAILMAGRIPLRLVADLAVCDSSLLEPLLRIAAQAAGDRPGWSERIARALRWWSSAPWAT